MVAAPINYQLGHTLKKSVNKALQNYQWCVLYYTQASLKNENNNTEEKILSSPSTNSQKEKNASATKEYYKTTYPHNL